MNDPVLFVDDEPSILRAIERLFHDIRVPLLTTTSPRTAMDIVRREKVAVVVSDNMMPEFSGVELLERVRLASPETVRILMTAHADLSTALKAINSGEVYRFIVKPWDNTELVETTQAALSRYRTLQALRNEDEAILMSLAQTIELKDPYTRGHCERVARYAGLLADALSLPPEALRQINHGCWLHDCGKIGVPEAILNCNGKIAEDDFETIRKHPVWGAEVARQARLPEMVINMILYHHEHIDGTGYPSGLAGSEIPLEARIVAVADVFDALTSDRPYRPAIPVEKAREILLSMGGTVLDRDLVELFIPAQLYDAGIGGE